MELLKNEIMKELKESKEIDGEIQRLIISSLIEPIRETYTTHDGVKFELITVFNECDDGYTIAYDFEDKEFCLGYRSKEGGLTYYSHYGSFIDTFLGM